MSNSNSNREKHCSNNYTSSNENMLVNNFIGMENAGILHSGNSFMINEDDTDY